MLLRRQTDRLRSMYNEYPRDFWVLMSASFIDSLGSALLFPFFTLYVTQRFGVGMTQVGLLFGVFSIASLIGSSLGGAFADRYGRKSIVLFGLVASAISSIAMGLVGEMSHFIAATVFVGIFANASGPARQAMVADLLPEEKRAQGYGVFRVVFNASFAIGPAIGGLLAARSYLMLFILDAIMSVLTAVVVYRYLPETRPAVGEEDTVESTAQSFGGYLQVFKNSWYMVFLIATGLVFLVGFQMNGTLGVFLRDFHGIPEQGFGYLVSLNAGMVILFQIGITRKIEGYSPYLILAIGAILYGLGFSLFGLTSTYASFIVAIAILTVGEMLVAPVGQAVVAKIAPEDMRGRYMAVFGLFAHMIPSALGIYLAGLVMDNLDPRWVWLGAGLVGVGAAIIYVLMHTRTREPVDETPLVSETLG